MDEVTLFLSIVIAGLSTLLFIVSAVAFHRLRVLKLLIINLAFFVFIIKGLLLIFEIISQDQFGLFLDIAIIVLLYFAVVKR
jgi:hypothetical protein